MNNNLRLYLLIPGVALIWAGVVFRLGNMLSPEREEPTIPQTKVVTPAFEPIKDSLVLSLDYEDPFLGGSSLPSKRKVLADLAPPKVRSLKKVQETLPRFLGGLKGPGDEFITGMVLWQGTFKAITRGKILGPWKVHRVYLDSLILSQGSRLQVLKKSPQP